MKNKNVGILIIGIGFVMGVIVWLFNNLLRENLGLTCSHGPTCGMYSGLNVQTGISFSIVAIVLIIGIVIFFTKPEEKVVVKTKKVKEKIKPLDLRGLNKREKKAVELLEKEEGMFQRELMEKLGIGKVGMTRLLDKLESREIVERKRRGPQNFVVLKRRN
jgi:uncharacterized membrane protein